MSIRLAYDALNPAGIPADAGLVFGYDSWLASDWDRFTNATKVRIAQHAGQTGKQYSILDVERFDANISQAPGWINKQQEIGAIYNTIYVQESRLADLRAACRGLHYYIIVAWWRSNGRPIHIPGTIGIQFAGNVDNGAYDLSAVYDDGWHPAVAA